MPKGKRKGKGKNTASERQQTNLPPQLDTSTTEQLSCSLRNVLQISEQESANPTQSSEIPTLPSETANTSVQSSEIPTTSIQSSDTSTAVVPLQHSKLVSTEKIKNDRMVITLGLSEKLPPGRLGRRVQLITNLYPVNLLPTGYVYHYDVDIIDIKRSGTSELSTLVVDKEVKKYRCLSTKINRKVISELLQTDINLKKSYAVYDGQKNLYSPSSLELKFPYTKLISIQENRTSLPNKEKDIFKVTIKPVKKEDKSCRISFEPLHELYAGRKFNVDDIQEAIMALETIFRNSPALKYVPIGRSFFHPDLGNVRPLGKGMEMWFGYYQSTRLGQSRPMINLDTTATVFFSKISLLKYFSSYLEINEARLQSLNCNVIGETIRKISKILKNVKIKVTHQRNERKYTIICVTKENAATIEFDTEEDGIKIKKKVGDYFLEKYDKKLKYPNLPCVRVKPESKKIYIPLEFCEIVEGQHCKKELEKEEKSEMIKYTALPPKEKFQKIENIRECKANYNNDEYLKKFKIEVSNRPMQVGGREIEAPNLNYQNDKCRPRNGSWNIIGKKFYTGANIDSWWLLSLASETLCTRRNLENFERQLCKIGNAAGIKFPNDKKIDIFSGTNQIRNLPKKFTEIKNNNVQLVVIVIPNKNKDLYKAVKQIAEVEVGLMTQCIDHYNVVENCTGSLLSNLCQKINAKMGGINHILSSGEISYVMNKTVIVIGADVSHASITDENRISVAAVVGSLDINMSRFACTYKLQRNENEKKQSEEIIVELKVMVKELLIEFFRHTRRKPTTVIFYRDGVSEGQFIKVKNKEISSIRMAFNELEKDFHPKITYAVVQKRHHVSFKPCDTRRPEAARNMAPGTVIDTDVVHPIHRDFYLCSHMSPKGTSRPGYYTILEDGNNFSSDEFQALTHYLCHTFVRCTKSISNPVPVRYAHLAAYRIRLLLPKPNTDDFKNKNDPENIPAKIIQAIDFPPNMKQQMYFV